jgi:serine/threonine protein kinase
MNGGSIERALRDKFINGIKNETLIASILKPAILAIRYLHSNNQMHRDIKCSNILISREGQIMLSDFVLSSKLKKNKKRTTLLGSVCWMAPEVLANTGYGYDMKADVWYFLLLF